MVVGRLEVWRDGCWGTVCDNHFGERNARIACHDMGMEPIMGGYYFTADIFGHPMFQGCGELGARGI
jgi:hypothetical protein